MQLFERPYIAVYYWSIITTTPPSIIFEILPHLTSRAFSNRQLKLRARELSHSCVNITSITRTAFRDVSELESFQTAKVAFMVVQVTGSDAI